MRRNLGVQSEPFVRLDDENGLRHLVRVGHVNSLSDTDPLQNETIVKLGSQIIRVPEPLDTVALRVLSEGEDD
jgi:hypothetical protein